MRPSSLNSTSGPGTGQCLNCSRRALLPGVASEPGPTRNTPRECRPGGKWPTAAGRGRGQPAGLGAADLTAVVATCSSAAGRCRCTGCASTMGVRSVHRAGEGCRLSDSADWYQG